MTDYDLDKLDELHAAATPEPWEYENDTRFLRHGVHIGKDEYVSFAYGANGELTATLRNAYPSLSADLRRLREENDRRVSYTRELEEKIKQQYEFIHKLKEAAALASGLYATLEAENERLHADYKYYAAQLSQIAAENMQLRAENDSLRVADIDKIASNLTEMRLLEENKRLRSRLACLKDEESEIDLIDFYGGFGAPAFLEDESPTTGADEEAKT